MGYSQEDIEKAREYIKYKLNGYFDAKGIFDLCDKIFFKDQIKIKIEELGYSDLEVLAVDSKSFAVILKSKNGSTPVIAIDENKVIIDRKRYSIDIYLHEMEMQIINMLLLLWGYDNLPYSDKLFKCMYREYFGHEGINTPKVKKSPAKTLATGGYSWWDNSCYLDSLLVILLFGDNSITKHILDVDVEEIRYSKSDVLSCPGKKIDSISKFRDLALYVQDQAIKDKIAIENGGQIKSYNIRKALEICIPDMGGSEGNRPVFNVAAVYNIIAELFPGLKIDIPSVIHRYVKFQNGKSMYMPDMPQYNKEAMFTFWDYLGTNDPTEVDTNDPTTMAITNQQKDDYKEILWGKELVSELLVFTNTGAPRIKILDQVGIEKGYSIIEGTRYDFELEKYRKFGPTILEDRYRLAAVIILQGTPESGEGGTHYTCYFSRGTETYYFNDIANQKFTVLPSIPETVFREQNGNMPAMYFYVTRP